MDNTVSGVNDQNEILKLFNDYSTIGDFNMRIEMHKF